MQRADARDVIDVADPDEAHFALPAESGKRVPGLKRLLRARERTVEEVRVHCLRMQVAQGGGERLRYLLVDRRVFGVRDRF